MSLFLRLALRNVFRNRVRTTLALLAIASGCAALIVNGGVIYNIFAELREDAIRSRHGHLQVHRSGYAAGHLRDPGRYLVPADETRTVVERIAALEHVDRVTRRRQFSGMVVSGERYVSFVGIGSTPPTTRRSAATRRCAPASRSRPTPRMISSRVSASPNGSPASPAPS